MPFADSDKTASSPARFASPVICPMKRPAKKPGKAKEKKGGFFGKSKKDAKVKPSKISEEEGHHPDITFGWGYAKISITTHAIEGLSENDFILAAKIDNIPNA